MLNWMESAPLIIALFGIGLAAFWAAFPAGIAMGMSPIEVIVIAVCSYLVRAMIVILIGAPVRARIMRRFERLFGALESHLVWRLWNRLGVAGLGLLAPISFGAQFSAAIGMTLGAPVRYLVLWMVVGAVVWAVIFTGASILGLELFGDYLALT
jgi:hypothetical protein